MFGMYRGREGAFELRGGTQDAKTVHPGHEYLTHREIKKLLAGTNGGAFVDIGGHCGGFSFRYRDIFDQIVIFEPFPQNIAAIKRNISLTDIANKVTLVEAAVSSISGTSVLHVNSDDTHSLVNSNSGSSIAVNCLTLDEWFSNSKVNPASVRLVKMDVEGAEHDVICGGLAFFKAHSPIIVAEANTDAELSKLCELANSLGYSLHCYLEKRNAIFLKGSSGNLWVTK